MADAEGVQSVVVGWWTVGVGSLTRLGPDGTVLGRLGLVGVSGDGDCFFNAVIETARHHPDLGVHEGIGRLAGMTARELRTALYEPFYRMVTSGNEVLLGLVAAYETTPAQIADLLLDEEGRWDNVAVDLAPFLVAAEFGVRIHHVDPSGRGFDVGADARAAELVLFRDTRREHLEHYSATAPLTGDRPVAAGPVEAGSRGAGSGGRGRKRAWDGSGEAGRAAKQARRGGEAGAAAGGVEAAAAVARPRVPAEVLTAAGVLDRRVWGGYLAAAGVLLAANPLWVGRDEPESAAEQIATAMAVAGEPDLQAAFYRPGSSALLRQLEAGLRRLPSYEGRVRASAMLTAEEVALLETMQAEGRPVRLPPGLA